MLRDVSADGQTLAYTIASRLVVRRTESAATWEAPLNNACGGGDRRRTGDGALSPDGSKIAVMCFLAATGRRTLNVYDTQYGGKLIGKPWGGNGVAADWR